MGVLARLGPHLEAALASFVHERGVASVASAVVVRGEPTWTFGYGSADVAGDGSVDAGTAYRIGSLTKPFTAAAVFRLRDRGALRLEDPVARWIPSFAGVRPASGATSEEVTVAHLVSHRAGLPGEVPALDEAADVYPSSQEVLDGLDGVTLMQPPGVAMRYSNLGYQLLGAIVAVASGSTFEAACARELLEPLGLRATGFDAPAGAALGHRARAFTDRLRHAADRRKRTNADGGLWSTADDLATWIRAQLGEADVAWTPTLAEMHVPGRGWFRERVGARTLLYHQGSTPGFAARLAFAPALGAGLVVLVNGEVATADLTHALADLVLDGVEGALPEGSPPAVPPPPSPVGYPAAWDDLVGFYVWPGSAMLFRLEERRGRLRLVDLERGAGSVVLEPRGDDAFVALDGGWAGEPVIVLRGGDGAVRALRLGSWTVARLVEA